jgi:hypothetical protein
MGLLSWFYLGDEVEKGKQLDEKLASLNRDALARGVYDSGTFAEAEANRQKEDSSTYSAQIDGAFGDGWRDGEQTVVNAVEGTVGAITGAAGSVVGAPLKGLLKGIPWWLWILGVGALLTYLGMLPGVLAGARKLFKK